MGFLNNQKERMKNEVKKEAKKRLKKAILKVVLPVLAKIILVIVLLVAMVSVAQKMKDLLNIATTFKTNIFRWLFDDNWIDLTSEIEVDFDNNDGTTRTEKRTLVDQYIYRLDELGISLKDLRLLGDADYETENVLEDPVNKAKVEKYIKSFVVADLITGQIHRRKGNELTKVEENNPIVKAILGPTMSSTVANLSADAELQIAADKIDGGIYLYRTKDATESWQVNDFGTDDGQNSDTNGINNYYRMEYTELEKFREKVEKFNEDDNPNISEIEKYFAVDENGKLLIAQVNGYTETKEEDDRLVKTEHNYTATIKTIDYEQKTSEYSLPYEFLVNLCMVTQNPEFVYHVAQMSLDTKIDLLLINNTTTKVTEKISEETRHKKAEDGSTEEYTVKVRRVTTQTSTNPQLELKKANTWSSYKKIVWTNKVNQTVDISEGDNYVKTTTTIKNNYSSIEGNLIRKSDNFLGLLRNKSGQYIPGTTPKFQVEGCKFDRYGTNVRYPIPGRTIDEDPLSKLKSGEGMLYSLLEQNERTEPLVELMKYYMTFPEQEYYELDESEVEEILGGYNESLEDHYVGSDYIVKTDEPGALKAVTKQELINIINGSFSGKQKENALSIADKLIECQDKYNVNAVFVLAFAREESGVGTADSSHVKKNNWLSWNLGKSYLSPQANIETVMRNIAKGSIYFSTGKYTISEIGHTYCPNDPPKYPTQGDDWVKRVTGYVKDMYNKIGVTVEDIVDIKTNNKIIEKAAECMKYLQTNGYEYPTSPGKGIPAITDIRNTKNAKIDCSAYVSWVLCELGYLDGRWTSATFAANPKGWMKITDKANVKAGDIVVYDGHVEICAEDVTNVSQLTKYNAGSTSAIKKSPYTSKWHGGFKFALRIIK